MIVVGTVGIALALLFSFVGYQSSISPCLSLVSICTVIFGWSVLYKNALRCASRAESHQLISQLMDRLEKLERDGIDYWFQDRANISRNRAIGTTRMLLSQLATVRMLLEQTSKRGLSLLELNIDLVRLRRALTLDAERPNSLAEEVVANKVEEIATATSVLRRAVYEKFLSSYPVVK